MANQLSDLKKSEIKALLSVGEKQVDLAKKYSVHQSTISRLALKIKDKGTVTRQVGSGRRKSLDKFDLEYMEKIIKINPRIG